jgi:two-component system LytT family response regulator
MENAIRVDPLQKMMVATVGRVDVVNVEDLVRIEAQSNYSKLYFADGSSLLVAKVLRKFEEQLSQNLFVRAHKTHLVNLQFIRSYEGKIHKMLVLENGENIVVARSKQRCVQQSLMGLLAV